VTKLRSYRQPLLLMSPRVSPSQIPVYAATSTPSVNSIGMGFTIPLSLLDFAIYATGTGCSTMRISGKGSVDSYDSSQGSYAQTKQLSKGIVGTSGNVSLSGGLLPYSKQRSTR